MSDVIDLSSFRAGACIRIRREGETFSVTLEPPPNRPGARGGKFRTYREAHFRAHGLAILLGRPIVDETGPGGGGGAAA